MTSTYDVFGPLRTSTISMAGFSKTLSSDYDQAGNRTRLTHPDGQAFTYAYDALGRLTGLYEGVDTSVSLSQFSYNTEGRLDGRADGMGSGTTYNYDTVGRLASQTDSFVGGSGNVMIGSLTYNPAGQITGISRNNDAYAWRDALLVNRSYAANGLNQYTAAGPASFTYDANGNLVSDGTNSFVYDAENRLISASNGTTLIYDPTGRLWQVTKGAADTRFLYDGDAMVAEYDGAGMLTARYVHGSNPGADDPLVWYGSNGAARWLHADLSGSIVAITNSSGGAPSIKTYDEYGIPGAANVGRFQYTGQVWLGELGMYHYKAQVYSPTLGRFMQVDPIGYEDQFNLYAYIGNDPVNAEDPTGTCGTGSRISGGDAIGCRVVEGFFETGRSANGTRTPLSQIKNSTELKRALFGDFEVRKAIWRAWKLSRGDDGPTDDKNEYGFWIQVIGNRFKVGEFVQGQGAEIRVDKIMAARPAGALLFFHVHPFRIGELPGITGWGISGKDVILASNKSIVVVSIGRRENVRTGYRSRDGFDMQVEDSYAPDFYKKTFF